VIFVCLTLAVISLAGLQYFRFVAPGVSDAGTYVDKAHFISVQGKTAADQLDADGNTLTKLFQDLNSTCSEKVPQAAQYLKDAAAGVSEYVAQMDGYTDSIQGLPAQINKAKPVANALRTWIAVGVAAPFAACSFLCVCVVLACTLGFMTCGAVTCEKLLLTAGIWVTLLTVVLAAALGAVALGFATVSGDYCEDASGNSVGLVTSAFGSNSTFADLSNYYLLGNGSNVLLVALVQGNESVTSFADDLEQAKPSLQQQCPQWSRFAEVDAAVSRVHSSIGSLNGLLSGESVYPLLSGVEHSFCNKVLVGLAWIVMVQLVVSLVVLPPFTLTASYFLARRRALAESQAAAGYPHDVLVMVDRSRGAPLVAG